MSSNPSPIAAPRVVVLGIVPKAQIPSMVYWSFLLFIFTIPFEVAELSFTSSSFSLSKLAGLLFFALYFLHYNPLLAQTRSHRQSLPFPPRAFWWFFGYIVVYVLHGFFLPTVFISGFFSRLFTLGQLLVFFWIASSLLQEEKLTRHVLLAYAVASAILAFGLILRLPGFSPASTPAAGVERETVLGYNANTLATLWALAVVALMGLCLNPAYNRLTRLLLGLLVLPLLAGIVPTGSRAGTGALMIGLLVYLVPYWRSKQKWAPMILALLGIAATIYLIMHNPSTAQRWQGALAEADFSGREEIFPAAIEMISERPFLGWQPGRFQAELARRLYNSDYFGSKDAHNLFLHLFMEVGMVGAVPFLVGFWLCGQAAWQGRTRLFGLLPLALFCTILAGSMSGTTLLRKPMWLVMALASASVSITAVGQANKPGRWLITRSPGIH